LFHVSDLTSKTVDGYFVGFPAIWNVVLLYLFAFQPAPLVSLAVVTVLVLLTFVPFPAVHPFRVSRLRPLTVLVSALWTAAAALSVANPFPSPWLIQALLISTAIYLAGVGLVRRLSAGEDAP
jgi:phosphatidylcholine synthase